MKKLLVTLSAFTLVLSFAACGKQDVPPVTTDDTTVSSADTTTDTTEASKETTVSSDTDAAVTEGTATSAPETSAAEETTKATEATATEAPVTSETTKAPAETTETTPAATTETTPSATEATTEATTEEATTAPETPDAGTNAALEVLNKIWDAYPADNKFSSFGGDMENAVMDAPGAVTLDAATLDRSLGFPQDSIDKISAGASLIHMLNTNTFTCGAYRVKDGEDTAVLAEAIRTNIQARRWMCGYPETLRILTVGDTMISMFGNSNLIDAFVEAAQSVYTDLEIVVNEPIQ